MLLCIFKNKFLCTTLVSTLAQQGNEGLAEMPDFQLSGVNIVCMPVPRKICHPPLSLSSWWFDGFPSRFFVWSRWWYRQFQKQLYALLCHIVTDRSKIKAKRENLTAKLIYPIRNGTVRYLAVSTHTLGPIHSRGGGGEGEGTESESFQFCLLINAGGDLD